MSDNPKLPAHLVAHCDENGHLREAMDFVEHGVTVTIYPPTARMGRKQEPTRGKPRSTVGSPYYRLSFVKDGRTQGTSGTRTFAGAVAKAAAIAKASATETWNSSATIAELVAAYLDADRPRKRAWGDKHQHEVGRLLERYFVAQFGSVRCRDIKTSHIQKAINDAPTAAEGKRVRTRLRALLNFAYVKGFLTIDPVRLYGDVSWQAKGRKTWATDASTSNSVRFIERSMIPSHEQVAALAHSAIACNRLGWINELEIYFSAYSGLRLGELFAVTPAVIDLEKLRVAVDWQWTEVKGKRVKKAPKWDKSRVTVFPARTPPTTYWPEGYPLRDQLTRLIESKARRSAELFTSPMGKLWLSSNYSRRLWHPAAAAAGWKFEEKFKGPAPVWQHHDLRHVFCTYLLDEGVPIAIVAVVAGHENVTTTQTTYINPNQRGLDDLGELMRSK